MTLRLLQAAEKFGPLPDSLSDLFYHLDYLPLREEVQKLARFHRLELEFSDDDLELVTLIPGPVPIFRCPSNYIFDPLLQIPIAPWNEDPPYSDLHKYMVLSKEIIPDLKFDSYIEWIF